jgi:hypothetical protein
VARSWPSRRVPRCFSLDPCTVLGPSPFTLRGRQVLRVILCLHARYLSGKTGPSRVRAGTKSTKPPRSAGAHTRKAKVTWMQAHRDGQTPGGWWPSTAPEQQLDLETNGP